MRIVPYSEDYYFDVLKLIEDFHKEAVVAYVGLFDEHAAIEMIHKFDKFDGEFANNAFLMIVDNKCQGVLAGMEYQSMTSRQRIFQELIWYVDPSHRRQGVRFFKEVEKMLKARGIGIIIMAVLENSKTDKIKRFYARTGYAPMESHWVKNL